MTSENDELIAEIMWSNEGVGNWRSYCTPDEDWGACIDDGDASFWEQELDGPDESYWERVGSAEGDEERDYEYEEACDDVGEEPEAPANDGACAMETVESGNRLPEIVEWLAISTLARPFANREGFFVPKGAQVRLQDGSVTDLFEWVFAEGLTDQSQVGEYSVVYTAPGGKFGEKLSFFKIVVDAPFLPSARAAAEPWFEDDIPF